jgi:hypothetical protein
MTPRIAWADWLDPMDAGNDAQLSFGLGASAGVSAFGFVTQAATKQEHEGMLAS